MTKSGWCQTCVRCGGRLAHAVRDGKPCHARCVFADEVGDDLLAVKDRFAPKLTDQRIADDLGVPVHVVRLTLEAARRRRLGRAIRALPPFALEHEDWVVDVADDEGKIFRVWDLDGRVIGEGTTRQSALRSAERRERRERRAS